jgi:asparagine synthase (glutamine-hydrolysing)
VGQVLLVQSDASGAARPAFERCLTLFRALLGLEPHDVMTDRRLAVAKLPRLAGPGSPIQRSERGGFRVAAGTHVGGGSPDTDLRTDLERLDGLFFVAAGDPGEVTCATDRGGRLHVYAVEIEGAIVVSTSALVLAALVDAPLDPLACQEMLGAGSVFEDRSLFLGVRKLEPASLYTIRDGRIASRSRYWSVAALFDGVTPAATVPALADGLVAAVRDTLACFERPIVDLTGGFDSRGIVAAAVASGRPFQCVVNGRDEDGDVRSAEAIARQLGVHLLRLRPGLDFGARPLPAIDRAVALTDGEFDAAEYADVLEIHERLARQGDATVNGSAGEVCRGYWWDLLSPHTGSTTHFDHARAARRFVPDDWADGILAAPAAPSLARHFEDVIRRANSGLEHLPNTVRADNVYLTLRMQRWAGRLASATDRIWPCATPFMFRRPLEAALTAPISVRARNRMARALIDRLDPALAALPMAGGYPASPIRLSNAHRFLPLLAENAAKAVQRARRAFGKTASRPPSASAAAVLWAQEEVPALLLPARMSTAGLYDPAALAAFFEASKAPGFAEPRKLGRILTLELVAQALSRARST